jgi:serine/threonine-protein kinase
MAPSTFTSGHTLVGRYRIIDLLGVGQTAEVYTAEDLSLHRTVVVKVLLAHLAAHEDVRRAFRDHIVRAATLSHAHLARVYDGGQEAGAIFMICEYLDGGSLEDVLTSGRTLSIDDGARLGRDVASALGYVHANGFVHGSLSPSKLLFDDEGRVRLSDIALAGLDSGYHEHFTLDDVRYYSPEQAMGEPSGPASDVYALALILFEAVTGTTPFEGATPEALLRARVDSSLPVRLELGTLDMLLAQAAVPDPRLRLDAEQFSSRLGAVVSDLSPLVVAPVAEMPLLGQFRPVEPRTSIGFHAPTADEIVGTTAVVASVGAQSARPYYVRASDAPPPVQPAARRGAPRDLDNVDYDRPPRSRRVTLIVAAVVLVVAAIAGGAIWRFGLLNQKSQVPPLVGLSFQSASTLLSGQLKSDGFSLSEDHRVFSPVAKNLIVTQTPTAGTAAKSGTVIYVTVSNGPAVVTMPASVIGKDCASATQQLAAIQVTAVCPSSAEVASRVTPAGRVAKVIYGHQVNPKTVPRGATVTLAVSTGSPATTTTTSTIHASTTTTVASTTTTTRSTTTTVVLTLVAVPNVVGQGPTQVNAAFKAAGLYYTTSGPGAGTTKWTTVVSQIPSAGTKVKKFSTISLNVR